MGAEKPPTRHRCRDKGGGQNGGRWRVVWTEALMSGPLQV
jgi:hypothetical protein